MKLNYLERAIMDDIYPENILDAYKKYIERNYYRRYHSEQSHELIFYLNTFADAISDHLVKVILTMAMHSWSYSKTAEYFGLRASSIENMMRDFLHYMNYCDEFYDKYTKLGDDMPLSSIDPKIYHRVSGSIEQKKLTLGYFKQHYKELNIFCEPHHWNIILAKEILDHDKHRKLRYCLGEEHPFYEYCKEKIQEEKQENDKRRVKTSDRKSVRKSDETSDLPSGEREVES